MSTRLFLVRHAESVWNAAQRVQGQADPPLSPRGELQAAILARVLGPRSISTVYTSPLQRAQLTAAAIAAPHGLSPHAEPALREIHLGAWQGQPFAGLGGHCPVPAGDPDGAVSNPDTGDDLVSPADGESLTAALARLAPPLDNILRHHRDESIVLVTHSIIGRIALCHLLGASLDLVPHLKLKVASMSLVRIDEDGAVLERLGVTA